MGAWEEMSQNERKINSLIDLVNLTKLMCDADDGTGARFYMDYKYNIIMIYDTADFWQVAKDIDRVPDIIAEEEESETGLNWQMFVWYRGVKIYTYLCKSEYERYTERIKTLAAEILFDDTDEDEDGADDDD